MSDNLNEEHYARLRAMAERPIEYHEITHAEWSEFQKSFGGRDYSQPMPVALRMSGECDRLLGMVRFWKQRCVELLDALESE